ncbi:MAG: YlbF family regulator [Phycisphaerae bacterium]|nr:YlbF family regulator [Phycisphaerae bacterium]
MDDIIADATALGKKMAAHPRMKAYMVAAQAVNGNQEAQDILMGYQKAIEKIQQLEAAGKPIEVADKRAISDWESKVANNDLLKRMMTAQADYLELMHRINAAIDAGAGAESSGSAKGVVQTA